MITCSKCGKENQDHYKFCLGCGAELPRGAAAKPFAPQTPSRGVAAQSPAGAQRPSQSPVGGMGATALVQPAAAGQLEDAKTAYVRSDYATAMQLLRPLAEQGNTYAQYKLGVMYDNGHGVPQDYFEALNWYRLAAEQGDADAQFNLGVMYDIGQGVPQDFAEAVKWFRLAAAHGYADAQFGLGVMYLSGQGEWGRHRDDSGEVQ